MTLPEKLKKDIENPEGFFEESDEDYSSEERLFTIEKKNADSALELIRFIRSVHQTEASCSYDRDDSTFEKTTADLSRASSSS